MEHCKLQIGCLIILLYIIFVYIRDIKAFKVQKTDKLFNVFIALGIFSVTMDAITAYTVNNPVGENQYEEIAYEVAVYHYEKWNGKGYPEGLSETQIPLCARIMAIADVFDAVSAKRCYRDAMPLEKCFDIIKSGKGQDFDPFITEVFLDMEDKITEVYKKNYNSQAIH